MGCTAMSIVFDEMACSMVSLLQITLSNSTISLVEFVGRESYARLTHGPYPTPLSMYVNGGKLQIPNL
jgi:hypothetical protein